MSADPISLETRRLAECEERIGYRFRDPRRLRAALTHASGANTPLASNERLEFLGDAVLGLAVCEHLYSAFPGSDEGELTRIKSVVVSRQTCGRLAKELGLDEFLVVGKGMSQNGAPPPSSALANAFESVLGAIYLDGGIEAARDFLMDRIAVEVEKAVSEGVGANFKSQLQQAAQRQFNATPTYEILDEKGPDHQKCFKVGARIGGQPYPPAWGMTKKDAEQRAARNALCEMFGRPIPYPAD